MCPNITNIILCLMFCFLVFFVLTKIFGLQTFELVIAGKAQVKMILLKMSQFYQV